jgi:hypothetical protein
LHSAFRGDGNNDRRYVCTPAAHRVGCGLAVSATAIEEFLRDAVAEVVSSPTVRAAMRPAKPGKPVVDVHALEQQLVQLGLDHDAGLISRSEWLARRGPLSERLDAAHAERAADEPDLSDLADAPDPAERFRGFSIDRQRAVLDRLIGTITVKPATRRGRGFDENRVRPVWKV